MYNYKLIIQYDGTKYNGWQKQNNTKQTIQGKLEAVLCEMTDEEIEIHGSGRTDRGVHAYGQVANFKCHEYYEPDAVRQYMNRYLPEDIVVLRAELADERFHSRLNAVGKEYEYHIWNVEKPDVFKRKYVAYVPQLLDVEKMRRAAEYFIGEHDFKSFCSNQKMKKSTVRTITDIQITKDGAHIIIAVRGNGFLYNMVRILSGTLIEVGIGERNPEEMPAIIKAKERKAAGRTAQPEGLFLKEVWY